MVVNKELLRRVELGYSNWIFCARESIISVYMGSNLVPLLTSLLYKSIKFLSLVMDQVVDPCGSSCGPLLQRMEAQIIETSDTIGLIIAERQCSICSWVCWFRFRCSVVIYVLNC